MQNLARLCHLIAEKRDAIPHYDYRNDASRKIHDDAVQALADELSKAEGAVIKKTPQGSSIRLSGIRATSTSGILGALANWRVAAQKKIAANGEPSVAPVEVRCTGCGSSWDDARLAKEKVLRRGILSCCPERKMVPAHARPAAPSLAEQALDAVWKFSLVIESSVRRGDGPCQYAGVKDALDLVKEARASLSNQVQDAEGQLTPEEAWTILCETPDITSPEEYPDHALITMEQLRSYMERAAKPTDSAMPIAQPSTIVTRQEALDFIGVATRNWPDMPPLCEDDIGDVATGLSWFIAKKAELDKIEARLKSLVTAHPEEALLAAIDDDTRMWFLSELITVANGSIPLSEIEAMVLRHLLPAKGGAA